MERCVEPELLDELSPDDPRAIQSRRDLERINAWMRNPLTMANTLKWALRGKEPKTIVEIGAGDGKLMLRVASRLAAHWKGVRVILVDRVKIVGPETSYAFNKLGWQMENVQADALEFLSAEQGPLWDAVVANLFLHHFSDGNLQCLLRHAANRAQIFAAVEPPRGWWPLAVTSLVGLIGCNRVTRNDAMISVRAGFAFDELSRLWPADQTWVLEERNAGIFSHLFLAQRVTLKSG